MFEVIVKEVCVHPNNCVQKWEAVLERVVHHSQWKEEEKQVHLVLRQRLGLLPAFVLVVGPGPAPLCVQGN